MRQLHILHCDVILLVKPGAFLAGNTEMAMPNAVSSLSGSADGVASMPLVKLGDGPGFAVCQCACGTEDAARGTGNRHAGGNSLTRHEGGNLVLPDRSAAMVTCQMHIRVPAAGYRQRATMQMFVAAIGKVDTDTAKAKSAGCTGYDSAGEQFGGITLRGVGAGIDDRRHINPGCRKVDRGAVAVIIVGEDGDAVRRGGGKAVYIAAHSTSLHDSRPVIVGKSDQPLGGTGA